MSDYIVKIKDVEERLVTSARNVIPTMDDLSSGLGRLFELSVGHAETHEAFEGTSIALYHDTEWTGQDIDVTCHAMLTKEIPASDEVEVEVLSAETVAYTIHHGTYKLLPAAYDAVIQWVYANGYKITSGGREVYVACGVDGDDPANVTEIHFPGRQSRLIYE